MDTSYLAAFIDSEGYVGVLKGNNSYNLKLVLTNTNFEVIEITQREYGGRISSQAYNRKKTIYRLEWCAENAKEVLLKVYDKLIIKKQRAELALGFPTTGKGGTLSEDEKQLRELIYKMLRTII